jgi:hypothetical protein
MAPDFDVWKARWQAERYALMLMGPAVYARFTTERVPMTVIARGP